MLRAVGRLWFGIIRRGRALSSLSERRYLSGVIYSNEILPVFGGVEMLLGIVLKNREVWNSYIWDNSALYHVFQLGRSEDVSLSLYAKWIS